RIAGCAQRDSDDVCGERAAVGGDCDGRRAAWRCAGGVFARKMRLDPLPVNFAQNLPNIGLRGGPMAKMPHGCGEKCTVCPSSYLSRSRLQRTLRPMTEPTCRVTKLKP